MLSTTIRRITTTTSTSRLSVLTRQSHSNANGNALSLLQSQLSSLSLSLQSLLGSSHPSLDTIAKYYFTRDSGKHIRPLVVILISQATNGLSPSFSSIKSRESTSQSTNNHSINEPLETRDDVLNDSNPSFPPSSSSSSSSPLLSSPTPLLPTQLRLAEITELIHVASLLHDDVIDHSPLRRGSPSAPARFGNKLSILAGDFLLARASKALSRLGSDEVVELVASVLANLVEGEVMQMKGNFPTSSSSSSSSGKGEEEETSFVGNSNKGPSEEIFNHYMKKTYLKTASLIAKSARAATILGGCGTRQGWVEGERVKDAAYGYGRNLGIAFQLIDDTLDLLPPSSSSSLGKPAQGADLKLGLATAPALYAWEEYPQLGTMIERGFKGEGEAEEARHLILKSSGPARTQELAAKHVDMAISFLLDGGVVPESESREALVKLARDSLGRKK
ncbi:terpenoid synthase [Meredithblackwellia eburnea MCA 4105]